jgi:peptidyl-prolyl cis-trans isomerase C
MVKRLAPAIVALAVLVAFGCAKDKAGEGAAVAKVGNTVITDADMDARIQEMPPFMKQQLSSLEGRKRLLEAMIEEELVYRDALALGLDKSEDFRKEFDRIRRDAIMRAYYDKVLEAKSLPTDDEVQRYYQDNQAEFMVPESVTARHILVKTQDEAAKLRRQLAQGADFADLAGTYSIDASSRNAGGMIGGPIMKGAAVKGLGLLPEFTDAALALGEGEVSQPVKTSKGYHIIKVEKRSPAGIKTLEEAKNDIVSKLQYEKRKTVKEETINQLKSKFKVVYMTETESTARTPEEYFKVASEASNPKDKLSYYEQFLKAFPKNERAYEAKFMIGFTMAEEMKDYDGAEKVFKEFLAQYPENDLSDDAQWMLENMRSGAQPDLQGE